MKTVKRLLIFIAAAVALTAVLSVTLLHKQMPHMRMTSLMREGRLAMEAGDYDEAADVYRLAISLNEKSVRAYFRLASACILGGDHESALYFLEVGVRKTGSARLRDAYNDALKSLAASMPPAGDETAPVFSLAMAG